jgi:hypothetical protein
MKAFLWSTVCLAIPTGAMADERIMLVMGHPGAAWEVYCTVNVAPDGAMTTQLQLSRDSMPAPFVPVEGMPFLMDRFKLLAVAMQSGTWPSSAQEDENRQAPFVSFVYTQRDGDDVQYERRVFQADLAVPFPVKDLFESLHDGGCLTPPN